MIAAVIGLELATSSKAVVLALVVVAPLLASSLVGPVSTLAYAVASLGVGAALGAWSHQYTDGRLGDQITRLATILVGGALAVGAARARVRREARLARVLRIAAVAQQTILPPVPERLGPLRLAASYDSAQEEASIGGDVYAAVDTPHGQRLLIADVRGHGLDAVRLASTVLGAFRERADERASLTELATDLDRAVSRAADAEDFVTAVLLQVSGAELQVANAGHPDPLLLRDGVAVPLPPSGPTPPLGIGARPRPVRVRLEEGDRLLLHTDGVTEARRPSDAAFFPLSRLVAPCLGSGTLEQGLAGLRAALIEWAGGSLSDDVTLLAVEFTGDASRRASDGP
ncbi:serine/threonine-protein phosphatase [Motilibacter sp. K478]|nr:serine/threonine-protein phosphatase [Motilibacter aurantiacus]